MPEREPTTVEGWACYTAAGDAMRGGGLVSPHIDPAAALTLAQAAGVPPQIAAPLVMAVQHGMAAGRAKLKEGTA